VALAQPPPCWRRAWDRPGTAQEIAESVVWLLGDAASYVTGSIIDVAGGR
jgi:NAD(P)-dependent dehydrogenase (short-subunit alcohol dehydrogenase family)